jgi:triosephosphate isomerase
MSTRRPLAIANWKLNGDMVLVNLMAEALNKVDSLPVEAVICPSYPFLSLLSAKKLKFSVGAQNVSKHSQGAYTGEVSASMLAVFDVKYVIVGHSERRAIFDETDDVIADKFAQAVEQGLRPVLCVGETESQRNNNETQAVISAQVKAVVDKVGIEAFEHAVIAYEPVWAIGTGKTATTAQAQQVHQFIRALIASYDEVVAQALPILYGGSVNSSNSKALFAEADIDGGLVGGASLKVDEFLAICQSV